MLTAAKIRAAEPLTRPYKIADGGGLFLYVAPNGLKSLRMSFRFGGKAQLLTFGRFPDISLAEARDRRDVARQALRQNVNPAGARRRAFAAANAADEAATFEQLARAWHAQQLGRWSAVHADDVIGSLERHVFPQLGAMPIGAIAAADVLRVLRLVEGVGAIATARRVRQRISAVFARAMAEGLVTADPAALVAKALSPSAEVRRMAAVVDVDEARAVLAAIDAAPGAAVTKLASRLLALTAVRSAVARGARGAEFEGIESSGAIPDLDPVWRVPAARMKLTRARKRLAAFDHVVPLSRQAVDVLRQARAIAGDSALVFPGRRAGRGSISENAIGELYRRAGLGGRHSPHGWRAAFSTILNECDPAARAAIDLALAHSPKDKVEAAYNRSTQMARRRALFQEWADILDGGVAAGATSPAVMTEKRLLPRGAL